MMMMTNSSVFGSDDPGPLCEIPRAVPEDGTAEDWNETLDWIAYKIIGPTVVGIGILGNVLNMIVLTRPSFKGVTYTYLIGLACSDLGVLLCAVTMMIRQIGPKVYRDSWVVSFFFAHMELPLANVFMASSIFIVVCLTVDRFASICTPTKFKTVHTSRVAKTAMFVCYVLACIISIPLVVLKKVCHYHPERGYILNENYEVTHSTLWKVYSVSGEVIVRFGPAVILTILNTMIIRRFRQITQKRRQLRNNGPTATVTATVNGGGGGAAGDSAAGGRTDQLLLRGGENISKKMYKEEKRLVVLLMSIVLLFFVTTTPVAFLNILYTDKLDDNFWFQVFRAMANCLELCNFALNFYIYFLCSKEFRKKFLSFFQFLLPQKVKKGTDFQSITLAELSQTKKNQVKTKTIDNV